MAILEEDPKYKDPLNRETATQADHPKFVMVVMHLDTTLETVHSDHHFHSEDPTGHPIHLIINSL